MSTEILIAVLATLASTTILAFLSWVLRKALQDLKSHVVPNGGSSLFDQARDAKELASKAVEISLLNEARLKQLEQKVDAIILSRIQ